MKSTVMMIGLLSICVLSVGYLLWAEATGKKNIKYCSKTIAAMCFVFIAILAGAPRSLAGSFILVGLSLSAIGDVLLLAKARSFFLGGMAAFGLAHIAYIASFLFMGPIEGSAVLAGGGISLIFCGGTLLWLWPKLGEWQTPVLAYTSIIGAMVAVAIAGFVGGSVSLILVVAAVVFAISDITVAIDRLVQENVRLRLVGLPLYFGAQILFALGVGNLSS